MTKPSIVKKHQAQLLLRAVHEIMEKYAGPAAFHDKIFWKIHAALSRHEMTMKEAEEYVSALSSSAE
ncbi:MAG: hypothetical protein ABIG66_01105 [Candidatus Kerfeldbacteria bacterium]